MATFSDIPYELLYEILWFTMPEDLENFAQISKRVQEVAKPLLKDHRALIRKYRYFESWSNGGKATALLLREIFTTPYIGHYVREANVDFDRASFRPNIYTESEMERFSEMIVENMALEYHLKELAVTAVRSLLTVSGRCAPDLDVTAVRRLLTDSGRCESAAFAFLLPLLPNLEILWMKDTENLSKLFLTHVLNKAPRAANPFLTKLARVCLTKLALVYYDPNSASVERLRPYAALPSVRELSASDVMLWRFGDSYLPRLASGVTKLELRANDWKADANGFCSFLTDFPRLEVFKLSCVGSSTVEPSLIKETLLLNLKTSLRTLTILADNGCQAFMGSLRGFEVLTELHTNWPVLIKPDRKLQETLPASLQQLKLDDSKIHRAENCKTVLQDVLSGNELGDLHLKDVTFRIPGIGVGIWNSYRRLQKDCYEQGLALRFERRGM